MARKPRKISRSGIYHVILRGVNKQRIFEQTEDYQALYRILHFVRDTDTCKQPVSEPNFFLYAYCIMDNHIHMLIQTNGVDLGHIMTRIQTTYAIYFNNTYERIGHLFQDRYKSEVVEDIDYFYELLSYIHRNPVKAALCEHIGEYEYSSFHELCDGPDDRLDMPNGLCCFPELSSRLDMETEYHNYEMALSKWEVAQLGPKPKLKSMNLLAISPEEIRDFVRNLDKGSNLSGLFERVKMLVKGSDSVICRKLKAQLDWLSSAEKDEAIVNALLEMTGTASITEFQRLDKPTMRTALAIMRESGIGDFRLSRLTGVSRGVILRASIYPKEK